MHVVFGVRGINHQVELFKIFMQSQMFPFPRKNLKTGKIEDTLVQGALRPIQLYEYVFPEAALPQVLSMLGQDPKGHVNHVRGQSFIPKMMEKSIQKILGLEAMPAYTPVACPFIAKQGVSIYGLGIKKDLTTENKEWGYEQEML